MRELSRVMEIVNILTGFESHSGGASVKTY